MQFQEPLPKGWVPEAMNQDTLDMGEVKKKKSQTSTDITIQPQYISFFSILTGIHRCLFNNCKTEILNMKTKEHVYCQ